LLIELIFVLTFAIQVLEAEKQKNLSGTQHKTSTPHDHAPGWNEHLASSSEASIKVRYFKPEIVTASECYSGGSINSHFA
jgi:hypothetical protein